MATKTFILPKNTLVINYDSSEETADHAARIGDVHVVGSGDDFDGNLVTGLRFSSGTLQYTYIAIVVADGVVTSVSAESAWTAVPSV